MNILEDFPGTYTSPFKKSKIIVRENRNICEWDDFVSKSPQRNFFGLSKYFVVSGSKQKLYFLELKGETIAALLLWESENLEEINRYRSYATYQNLFFAKEFWAAKKSEGIAEELYFLLYELDKRLKNITLSLHHSIEDIRAVDWINLDKNEKRFDYEVKFTSLVELSAFEKEENIFCITKESRKNEYDRASRKLDLKIGDVNDIEWFISLYYSMFKTQGISLSHDSLSQLRMIIEGSILNGSGILMLAFESKSSKPISAIFIQRDDKTAYYQFSASNQESRKLFATTFLLVKAFLILKEAGCEVFDFMGVNSPYRGFFKTSFGGKLSGYFEINSTR